MINKSIVNKTWEDNMKIRSSTALKPDMEKKIEYDEPAGWHRPF